MDHLEDQTNFQPHIPDRDSVEREAWDLLNPKKRVFIEMMVKSFGNITQSCNACGITRTTYHRWMQGDPVFAHIINEGEYEERLLDFAESKLVEKVNKGDTIATIFLLKTRGKKRGYVEKQEVASKLSLDRTPSWFDAPKKELSETPPALPGDMSDAVIISETKNNPDAAQ